MWDSGTGMGWWMVIGSVWFVLFWGAVIWLMLHAFSPGGDSSSSSGESALDIAKRRYAAGEITKEQYDELRRDLTA